MRNPGNQKIAKKKQKKKQSYNELHVQVNENVLFELYKVG